MKPNDIEIIELMLIKSLHDQISKKLKENLYQDEEFKMLFDDMEILIAAIRVSAKKTTLQDKVSNLKA